MLRIAFVFAGLVASCAHAPPANPEQTGILLRLRPKHGERVSAKGKLAIETDAQGGKDAQHANLSFTFSTEEIMDSVDGEGNAQVTARLLDVASQGNGVDQRTLDEVSLAFDELKITFKRSAMGEVSDLNLGGVRSPLDDKLARTVVNVIFGAARGALLPSQKVDLGSVWTVETEVGTVQGVLGTATYRYRLAKKSGSQAVISCESSLDAKTPGAANKRKMVSKSTSEYHFDLAGRVNSALGDAASQMEEPGGAGLKQRVRYQWTIE